MKGTEMFFARPAPTVDLPLRRQLRLRDLLRNSAGDIISIVQHTLTSWLGPGCQLHHRSEGRTHHDNDHERLLEVVWVGEVHGGDGRVEKATPRPGSSSDVFGGVSLGQRSSLQLPSGTGPVRPGSARPLRMKHARESSHIWGASWSTHPEVTMDQCGGPIVASACSRSVRCSSLVYRHCDGGSGLKWTSTNRPLTIFLVF